MIHQDEVVIGVCVPRPVDIEWAGGLPSIGVAQVRRDAPVLALELLDRVKGVAALQTGDRRVQSTASDEQQRETGTGLLKVNANGALFIEGHGSSSLTCLLSKHVRRCDHRRRCDAGCQYVASDRVDNW